MNKLWSSEAWDDYIYWVEHDDKIRVKINTLLLNIDMGQLELKKDDLSGLYTVTIDEKNYLVFKLYDNTIEILQCGSSYRDK